MDFCGNPFHDIPQFILWALPFLGPLYAYLRWGRKRPSCKENHQHHH